ncbi:MAG TPA: FliH/SctL family protein [Tepidisphaeraceae bacterium]|nr:FliH/SctL family protein [Tepidisphaeraceae bacterium]
MPVIKSANAPSTMVPFSMRDIEEQARLILLRARGRAEQLIAEAQSEAESLKKQAFDQGRADGKTQGTKEGIEVGRKAGFDQALAENKAKLQSIMQAMVDATSKLESSRLELDSNAIKEVIQLAAAIARRVTRRQALIEPQVLEENLAEAVKLVIGGSDVRIAMNPDQLRHLQAILPKIQKTMPRFSHVEWVEDATVTPGGCRLLTVGGVVDADLETQLDRVIGQLLPTTS